MKKFMAICLLLVGVIYYPVFFPKNAKLNVLAETKLGYAEYISTENAPIIDGEIDEVWFKGSTHIATSETITSTGEVTYGMITILWNETGLYFLGCVIDTTVNLSDRCNLWVSETYFEEENEDTYPNVSGSYFLCLNPKGENLYSAPDSWEDGFMWTVEYKIAGKETESGYTVEAYVPLTGTSALEKGAYIGFDVSIDSYLGKDAERDDYVNWNGEGWYWQKPSSLGKIRLIDVDKTNGSFIEPSIEDSVLDENSGAFDDSGMDTTNQEGELSTGSKISNGCVSNLSAMPLCGNIIMSIGFVLLEHKKKK